MPHVGLTSHQWVTSPHPYDIASGPPPSGPGWEQVQCPVTDHRRPEFIPLVVVASSSWSVVPD